MKKYINTSNYYLSTTTSIIANSWDNWTFDVADVTVDWVVLPFKGYYWVDVDFGDVSKREIFRVYKREWYTLYYDARISPNGMVAHQSWASVWLRDFSQLLNSLSTNTDNFWEVEQTGDLNIKVRGWVVYHTSNMNADTGKILVDDATFTLWINNTIYIVLEKDEILWWIFQAKTDLLLEEEWQYPIAKITTGATMIDQADWIIDLRGTIIGNGNMRAEIYDPDWKRLNVYLMDNMEQSVDWEHLFVTQAQVDLWNSYQTVKQDLLVSWQNIVTINGKSIIDPSVWPNGNISLDTILTCWWETYTTEDGVSSFTFTDKYPLTEDAFIVFTDSGTMMVRWEWENWDYTYNSTTHTITFNDPLASDEHATIWMMYDSWDSSVWIWDWHITIKWWDDPETQQKTFSVNQDTDETIDIGEAANDTTITVKQWWKADQTFTTNQASPSNINLQGIIPVTQQEYDDTPDSKLTDWNWYFIYE